MRKTGIRFLIAILLAANLPVLARENLSDSALTAEDRAKLSGRPGAELLDVAMHPQVSGRPHMIAMLEEFIQYALGKGAWIAPFRDVLQRTEF